MKKQNFVSFLGLLVLAMWASNSARADCSSSWYNAGDTSNIELCGLKVTTTFKNSLTGMSNGIAIQMAIPR